MVSSRILALIMLTAASFAAAPAHAQSLTLNSGDALTVTGAGTVGTYQGKTVANTTSSYSAPYNPVILNGTSTFTFGLGGSITAVQGGIGILAEGSGALTITGGSIATGPQSEGIFVAGTGPVTIAGGSITTGLGSYGLFNNGSDSTINLFSLNDAPFLINGQPMNNTSLTHDTGAAGTISGLLEDGETFNTTFDNFGILNLNVGTPPAAVPEASTTVSFGLLLGLGMGGILAARRRKSGAA